MQSFIALTAQSWANLDWEDEKQTWKIFINVAQNKDNHESVSNLYWQFVHNKTHFWLKMYHLFDKTCVQHWKSAKISNLKKKVIWVEFALPCLALSATDVSCFAHLVHVNLNAQLSLLDMTYTCSSFKSVVYVMWHAEIWVQGL